MEQNNAPAKRVCITTGNKFRKSEKIYEVAIGVAEHIPAFASYYPNQVTDVHEDTRELFRIMVPVDDMELAREYAMKLLFMHIETDISKSSWDDKLKRYVMRAAEVMRKNGIVDESNLVVLECIEHKQVRR